MQDPKKITREILGELLVDLAMRVGKAHFPGQRCYVYFHRCDTQLRWIKLRARRLALFSAHKDAVRVLNFNPPGLRAVNHNIPRCCCCMRTDMLLLPEVFHKMCTDTSHQLSDCSNLLPYFSPKTCSLAHLNQVL